MELRECGRSGLKLSVLGLGCWAFGGGEYWGRQDQADVDAVVRRAVRRSASPTSTPPRSTTTGAASPRSARRSAACPATAS